MREILNIIACGQCGTRLGKQFEKNNIKVSYLNFDKGDSLDINVPQFTEQTKKGLSLLIGGKGTGRSVSQGEKIISENKSKVNAFLEANTYPNKVNVLLAGLGGGSGSSIVKYASEYIKQTLNRHVAIISTLPNNKASGSLQTRNNAYNVLREIKSFKFDFFILADNEIMCNKFKIDPLVDGWGFINERIITNFLSVENIVRDLNSSRGIGSIDDNELIKVLTMGKGGFTSIISEKINFKDIENLAVNQFIKDNELCGGFDYKKANSFVLSLVLPKGNLPDNVKQFIKDIDAKFNTLSLSGFKGSFESPDFVDKIQINILANGMGLPMTVKSRIKNLLRDKERLNENENIKKIKDDDALSMLADDFVEDNLSL